MMAESVLRFELVTPARLLVSEEADMVVVPGGDGDFGVLPGHAPRLSTVRPGVLDLYRGGAVEKRIFVAGGFAEVSGERCTVLAEEAVAVEDIDYDQAGERVGRARRALEAAADETARQAAEQEMAAAEAMVRAAAEGGGAAQ